MTYFNKAQSLSELAIFGGLLLLVLSYFVGWGIRLNYQQDAQMRAFRLALASAVTEGELRPDAEATIVIIEDKLVPDPRNMVGKGDLVTVSGQGNVVWGNQLQRPMSLDAYDRPRLKYVINGVERDYSVAEIRGISNAMYDQIWVLLSDQESRKWVQWSGVGNEIRCYRPTDASPMQARILTSDAGLETQIVTAVSDTSDGPLWYIVGFPETTLNHGDPVSQFNIVQSEYGEINPKWMSLDEVKEYAISAGGDPVFNSQHHLEGFMPGQSEVETSRKESLLLLDTTAQHQSITQFDTTGTTITHYVRSNAGVTHRFPDAFTYTPPVSAHKGSWVWTTSK